MQYTILKDNIVHSPFALIAYISLTVILLLDSPLYLYCYANPAFES
jgi:hypothetical protein